MNCTSEKTMNFFHTLLILSCAMSAFGDEPQLTAPQIFGQEAKYDCTVVKNPPRGVPYTFRLCVHQDFKDAARGMLRQGFGEFVERIHHESVRRCLKGRHLDLDDVKRAAAMEKFLGRLKAAETWIDTLGPTVANPTDLKMGRVYISPLDEKSPAIGLGYLGYFQVPLSETAGTYPHFSISVRVDMGEALTAAHLRDAAFWAALLGNALFNNLGMEDSPLRLSFTNSYLLERCLLWDGKIPQAFVDENVGAK